MSDRTPDPYLAQTGFDADAWTADDRDEDLDLELDDADDELGIEQERAREN